MNTKPILYFGVLLSLLLAGCQTTNTAGRTLASACATVDAAMQGWATYVALGKATPAQETSVREAYAKFQSAESAAEVAYVTFTKSGNADSWQAAAAALRAAQASLLQLIQQFHP